MLFFLQFLHAANGVPHTIGVTLDQGDQLDLVSYQQVCQWMDSYILLFLSYTRFVSISQVTR